MLLTSWSFREEKSSSASLWDLGIRRSAAKRWKYSRIYKSPRQIDGTSMTRLTTDHHSIFDAFAGSGIGDRVPRRGWWYDDFTWSSDDRLRQWHRCNNGLLDYWCWLKGVVSVTSKGPRRTNLLDALFLGPAPSGLGLFRLPLIRHVHLFPKYVLSEWMLHCQGSDLLELVFALCRGLFALP